MRNEDIQAIESRLNGVCLRINQDVLKTYRGERSNVMWRPLGGDEPTTIVIDEHQTRPNYCKVILDQFRDLTVGKGVVFEADEIDSDSGKPKDPADAEESKEERILKVVWGDMGAQQQANAKILDLVTDGGPTGTYVMKINPDTIAGDVGHVYKEDEIELIVQQAENLWLIVDGHNVSKIIGYLIYYTLPRDQGQPGLIPAFYELHVRSEDGDSWQVWQGETKNASNPAWTFDITETNPLYVWPYPFPQLVVGKVMPRTGSPYGRAAFEDIELLNNIWFTESSLVKIVKFHSAPKTIVSGPLAADGATLDAAADGVWVFRTEEGKDVHVTNLEMNSDLNAGRDLLKTMVSDLFSTNGAVDIRLDTLREAGMTAPSSLAIRTAMLSALLKRQTGTMLQNAFFSEVNRRVLCLLGMDDYKKRRIAYTTIFADPLPYSEQEQAQTIGSDIDNSLVSRETASKKRGYDYSKEKARMDAENKEIQANDIAKAKAMADAMPAPMMAKPGGPAPAPKPSNNQMPKAKSQQQ